MRIYVLNRVLYILKVGVSDLERLLFTFEESGQNDEQTQNQKLYPVAGFLGFVAQQTEQFGKNSLRLSVGVKSLRDRHRGTDQCAELLIADVVGADVPQIIGRNLEGQRNQLGGGDCRYAVLLVRTHQKNIAVCGGVIQVCQNVDSASFNYISEFQLRVLMYAEPVEFILF